MTSRSDRHHRGLCSARGYHPTIDPDDRVGWLISTSIAAMYLAGIVPGLLIAGAQMATVHVYAVRRGYPTYPKDSWVADALRDLAIAPRVDDAVHHRRRYPARLVHGNESACVRCSIRLRCRRSFTETGAKQLYKALLDTGRLAGVALFCVGTASAFGWLLAYYKIPEALLANVSTWGMGPIARASSSHSAFWWSDVFSTPFRPS